MRDQKTKDMIESENHCLRCLYWDLVAAFSSLDSLRNNINKGKFALKRTELIYKACYRLRKFIENRMGEKGLRDDTDQY